MDQRGGALGWLSSACGARSSNGHRIVSDLCAARSTGRLFAHRPGVRVAAATFAQHGAVWDLVDPADLDVLSRSPSFRANQRAPGPSTPLAPAWCGALRSDRCRHRRERRQRRCAGARGDQPRLIAWLEAATVRAAMQFTGPGQTTVGTAVRIEHRRATTVGGAVDVVAEAARRTRRPTSHLLCARR